MSTARFVWSLLVFFWQGLPVIMAIIGYILFSQKPLLSIITAAMLGVGAVLIKKIILLLRPAPSSHGTARFAEYDDISHAGLFTRKGIILGRKNNRVLRYKGDGHLLTFAPTRSGKGVSCVIPNLLDYSGSVVVTDIKGENIAITRNYREKLGSVYELAPFKEGEDIDCYNPFEFIRRGSPYELDDTRLIAEMLVVSECHEANHWEREARTLITCLILHITLECELKYRNPAGLRHYLMDDAEGFELTLARMMNSPHSVIRRIASGFSQKEAKERSSVISTAQAATEVFESPRLANITNRSTFRIEELKRKTTSLYIVIPPEYLESYRPYIRMIIGLCTAAMTRNVTKSDHEVLFLLDELPALGYMRPIEEGIGYLAGYQTKLWLFVQDLDQLKKTYPKARSMIANCAVRQAFNIQDPETARLLSEMMGTSTIRMQSAGSSGRLPFGLLTGSYQSSSYESSRELMTAGEVMSMNPKQQLLFIQSVPVIKARKIRYFDKFEWIFWGK